MTKKIEFTDREILELHTAIAVVKNSSPALANGPSKKTLTNFMNDLKDLMSNEKTSDVSEGTPVHRFKADEEVDARDADIYLFNPTLGIRDGMTIISWSPLDLKRKLDTVLVNSPYIEFVKTLSNCLHDETNLTDEPKLISVTGHVLDLTRVFEELATYHATSEMVSHAFLFENLSKQCKIRERLINNKE